MSETKNPTKKIRIIRDSLGENYKIIPIDFWQNIYRSYKNYEIEVSGLNNNKKNIDAMITILKDGITIEFRENINSKENLKAELEKIINEIDNGIL